MKGLCKNEPKGNSLRLNIVCENLVHCSKQSELNDWIQCGWD